MAKINNNNFANGDWIFHYQLVQICLLLVPPGELLWSTNWQGAEIARISQQSKQSEEDLIVSKIPLITTQQLSNNNNNNNNRIRFEGATYLASQISQSIRLKNKLPRL